MTVHEITLSRRALLKNAGGLTIAMVLPMGLGRLAAQGPGPSSPPPVEPNAFIHIAPDSNVTVLIKHIEFGQGPFTGLATLVAEEMDADWAQMRAEHAPANQTLYANLFMGLQGTGGSTAMANSYIQMRKAGAMARWLLVQAAAQAWNVPAGEVTVDRGVLAHAASNKQARFGDFAAASAKLKAPQDVPLKDVAKFRLIGHDRAVGRIDSLAKSTGAAKFSIDQTAPDMLTVVVAHPPRFGATVASFDAAKTLAVKGVVAVKRIPSGIAVYARGTWPAIKGRNALRIVWDDSKAEPRGSADMAKAYLERAKTPGKIAKAVGNVEAGFATPGATIVEADYVFPYLAHAPMEPLGGYIEYDGKTAVARFGSQFPGFDHPAMSKTLGLSPDQMRIEPVIAGGSFGRRATGDAHFAIELAEIAKAMPGHKLRLTWTREDDIHGGYYRPLLVHRMKGAVKDGKIIAWSDSIVGQSFAFGGPMEKMMVKDGVDSTMVEGSDKPPYALPAFRCDATVDSSPVTTLWWRSVGHTHTGYAVETFVDLLLEKAGKDPIAGRLELMREEPRAAAVLRAVAKLADWNGAPVPKGRARGVAVVESFSTFVAEIAEVSLDENGEPRVHKVWAAVDCGTAVNPDIIRAQVEGGIGYATGHILYAEVPLVEGRPTVSNFNDYRSLRIMEMPQVEVTIVDSTAPPTGIGEPGVPPCGPAIANALARLGRDRPTHLPMVRRA